MSIAADQLWSKLMFYKAYLPASDAARVRRYTILRVHSGAGETLSDRPQSCSPMVSPAALPASMTDVLFPDALPTYPLDTVSVVENETKSVQSELGSATPTGERGDKFYFALKKEISPPSIKQILGKVRHCYEICSRSVMGLQCTCNLAHYRRLNTIPIEATVEGFSYLFVSASASVYCIEVERIRPTAGFYFACALLKNKVLAVVQPVLCRYNASCRYGVRCLYIHADVSAVEKTIMTASMPLENWLKAHANVPDFLSYVSSIGLNKVGDVQELSESAFDALVSRSDNRWLLQWLNISVIRDIQGKSSIESALATFHGIKVPIDSFPSCLTTVSSLLALSSKEFYDLGLPLNVQAVCEKIRCRFESDRNYNIIELKKEKKETFFTRVTPLIETFRQRNAHVSWRKKDPMRPVVTCMITFVDENMCNCRANVDELNRSCQQQQLSFTSGMLAEGDIPDYFFSKASDDCDDDNSPRNLTQPEKSWCRCSRFYEIAVNYELSTPSGSRCSEQNALGKLASLGIPTSAVREVFVHGENRGSTKDPNPLFPCGVCENMLRKVNHDVNAVHNGDVLLYMFDSTIKPKKLVYLPITEISHRDGKGFKKFLADMREE